MKDKNKSEIKKEKTVSPEPAKSEDAAQPKPESADTTSAAPERETLFRVSSEQPEPVPEQVIIEKLSTLTPGEAELASSELAEVAAAQSAEPEAQPEPLPDANKADNEKPVKHNKETKPEKPPRKKIDYSAGTPYYLRITGTLAIVCACVAIMLAAINGVTAGKIAENEEKAADEAVEALFSNFDKLDALDGTFTSPVTGITAVISDGATVGYCVFVSPRGFANEIDLAVGVDLTGKATGVKVITINETPGVGSKTGSEDFLSQFTGKTANITLGSDIDAIAGATISSKAVFSGVKAALEAVAALPNSADTAAETSAVTASETAAETTGAETVAETVSETTAAETSTQTETTAAAAELSTEGSGV
jgi:Predicted NADH:ubiquinone oxidoreductase, subunit RnfG